jgi:hypothetical protein
MHVYKWHLLFAFVEKVSLLHGERIGRVFVPPRHLLEFLRASLWRAKDNAPQFKRIV